jgi:hypothetical protein
MHKSQPPLHAVEGQLSESRQYSMLYSNDWLSNYSLRAYVIKVRYRSCPKCAELYRDLAVLRVDVLEFSHFLTLYNRSCSRHRATVSILVAAV